MAYVKIILALLQIVESILDWSKESRLRQEGADAEIARATARILVKTEFARSALAEFSATPGSADDFLRSLEPKSGN